METNLPGADCSAYWKFGGPPPLKLDTLGRLVDQEVASHIETEAGIDGSANLPWFEVWKVY